MSRKKRATAPHAQKAGGGFAAIPHDVIDSPAWQDLSCHARALLVEVVRRFNGHNNGHIGLDARTARERLGASNRNVQGAFDDLLTHGLIEMTEEAIWQERRAREYRLTWALSGRSPPYRQPTFAYRTWSTETPVMRIDRGKARGKKGVTPAVTRAPQSASPAVTDPARPATDGVTARMAEPQKTVDPQPVPCYPVGNAYSNTIGGRRRLATKAKATPPCGVAELGNEKEDLPGDTELAAGFADIVATVAAMRRANDAEAA